MPENLFDFPLISPEEEEEFALPEYNFGDGIRQAIESETLAREAALPSQLTGLHRATRASTAAMERKGFLGRYATIVDEKTQYKPGGGFDRKVSPMPMDWLGGITGMLGGKKGMMGGKGASFMGGAGGGAGGALGGAAGSARFGQGVGLSSFQAGGASFGAGQAAGGMAGGLGAGGAGGGIAGAAKGMKGMKPGWGMILQMIGGGIKGYLAKKYGARGPDPAPLEASAGEGRQKIVGALREQMGAEKQLDRFKEIMAGLGLDDEEEEEF
jgi:hypothetical protein